MKKNMLIGGLLCALVLLSGCSLNPFGRSPHEEENSITRGEWISLLVENIDATSYASAQPYFKDVDEGDNLFNSIQTAVEWDIIDAKGWYFLPDETATGEFIAITSIKSFGEEKVQRYLSTDKDLSDKDFFRVAQQNQLIKSGDYKNGISREEANEVILAIKDMYFNVFWMENAEEYEYVDGVSILEKSQIEIENGDENIAKISTDLNTGDVIVYSLDGFQIPQRVGEVLGDGRYKLETPEMNEVYSSVFQSGYHELTIDDVLHSLEGKLEKTSALQWKKCDTNTEYGLKISALGSSDGLNIYIENHETGETYRLPDGLSIPGDYADFQANLDVKSLRVRTQLDYTALEGVRYADVALDIDTYENLTITCNSIVDKKIKLFEVPIAVGGGLVGVDVQIYLILTMDGELYLEANIPCTVGFHYEEGKGIRCINNDFEVVDPIVRVNAKLDSRIMFAPILFVGYSFPILDAQINVGAVADVEILSRINKLTCTDVAISYPVTGASVGDTEIKYKDRESLVSKMGISGNWEIISIEEAPVNIHLHHEKKPNEEGKFVDKCTWNDNDSNEEDLEQQVEKPVIKSCERHLFNAGYEDGALTEYSITYEMYNSRGDIESSERRWLPDTSTYWERTEYTYTYNGDEKIENSKFYQGYGEQETLSFDFTKEYDKEGKEVRGYENEDNNADGTHAWDYTKQYEYYKDGKTRKEDTYDSGGQLTHSDVFDSQGRLRWAYDYDSERGLSEESSGEINELYRYYNVDKDGNITEIKLTDSIPACNHITWVYEYYYDYRGFLIKIISSHGDYGEWVSEFVNNEYGNPTIYRRYNNGKLQDEERIVYTYWES